MKKNMIDIQVAYCFLRYNDNCVSIKKKKGLLLTKKFLFSIAILLIGAIVLWSTLARSPNAFQKKIDLRGWLFLFFVVVILIIHVVFSTIRLLRVMSDYEICKLPGLTINGSQLAGPHNKEIFIVVQDVGAVGSVGGSFTVGIARGHKFFGLCYELRKEHAKEIADFLAANLEYKIDYRSAIFFPLFKLH